MTKIFIVVLNWKRRQDTLETLRSLRLMDIPSGTELEVVVVDNASKDGSVESFRKFETRKFGIKVLENLENFGFAEGNNVGIKYSLINKAEYIMILNNDTMVHKDILKAMILFMKNKPRAGAVSPKIYFAPGYEFHSERYKRKDIGKVIWYAGGVIDWKNVYGLNRGIDEVDQAQYNDEEKTDFTAGACTFFRAKALKGVHGYDRRYYMYMEDVDLSLRLKQKGWESWYAPSALLWHKVGRSSVIGSALADYFLSRNKMIFGMTYASSRTRISLFRESIKLYLFGRKWQKIGVRDYYLRNFGKGSWRS